MNAREILSPDLPYDMGPRVDRATQDAQLLSFVERATDLRDRGREGVCRATFGARYDDLRRHAGAIKQATRDRLDLHLGNFVDRATAKGTQVHFAGDGAEANAIVLAIARRIGAKLCVKAKSMVTEETQLLHELQAIGVETLETDLGEFILQIDDDAPSHIVTPMIHKDRIATAKAFTRVLGAAYTEDPEQLTRIAREHMRAKYRKADLGISGANFLLADSGTIVLCTNEGNADFCVAGPKVHIAIVGIEKVVPSAADVVPLLKLLARSATAQPLTVYTTFVTGPRKAGEHDGPEELHVVLVDNGRTELLRAQTRELLRCIRCGACLNACPVYRKVGGGHAYGAVYSGPIGAVVTPHFQGLANYVDLPQASSLCGACFEACPVHIDIPSHLILLREQLVKSKLAPSRLYRIWARLLQSPWLYALVSWTQRIVLRALGKRSRSRDPYRDRRMVRRAPGPASAWTAVRDLPSPTGRNFRHWWREHEANR